MAANSEKIDQFIDTAATTKQFDTLASQIDTLDTKFIELTKTIKSFNDAAKEAKGFVDFTKSANAAATATEKLIQIQGQSQIIATKLAQEQAKLALAQDKVAISNNNVTLSNNRLQVSQDKAAESAKKALSPYQQLSKELDHQRLAAKDLGVQYGLNDPRFKAAQQSVLKLDAQLKTLDKSLGQNQRNVGDYKDQVKNALTDLYGELNSLIPGAGTLTRTIVQGFQNIPRAVSNAKNSITGAFTNGGFGFKPSTGPEENTAATNINTTSVNENTAANEANAASEAERTAATVKDTDVIIENNLATKESNTEIGGLSESFTTFSTAAFVAAMGSAIYYLSEFKSTGNTVTTFLGGLKNQFFTFGKNIVTSFQNLNLKSTIQGLLFPGAAVSKLLSGTGSEAFNQGVDLSKDLIQVENLNELYANQNEQLQADASQARARSQDRLLDITERQKALKQAQADEQKVLENQKNSAEITLNAAIRIGDKANKLTSAQVAALEKGDLGLAQTLAQNGQQFTSQGYELYKQGIEKKIQLQQSTAAEQIRLQADADNTQLRADRALAQAQDRLDKARLDGAKETAQVILNDTTKGYQDRLKANDTFVNTSIALAEKEKQNQLESAGLGSTRGGKDTRTEAVTRLAIEQETTNKINGIRVQGSKTVEQIQKEINDDVAKDQKRRIDDAKSNEKALEDVYINAGNERLLQIDSLHTQEAQQLANQYSDGAINYNEYQVKLKKLDEDTAQARIQTQIDTTKKIIAAQAASVALGTGDPKALQKSADDLTKLQIQASDEETKVILDNEQKIAQAKSVRADLEKQLISQSIDLVQSLVDNGYKVEINALEQKSTQLQNNADVEKTAIENSLGSTQYKAQQEKILDAQVAAQKKLITDEENKIKNKQAQFDKDISIAKILQDTITAEVGALQYLSNPITAFLYPEIAALIGALGLAQLVKAESTPVPKYKFGTRNHPGGLATIGDDGFELVKYPSGLTFLSPDKATTLDMPAGTTVVPHLQTVKELQKIKYAGGEAMDMREVAELLRENNKYQKKIVDKPTGGSHVRGIASEIISAQRLIDRRNNYFK